MEMVNKIISMFVFMFIKNNEANFVETIVSFADSRATFLFRYSLLSADDVDGPWKIACNLRAYCVQSGWNLWPKLLPSTFSVFSWRQNATVVWTFIRFGFICRKRNFVRNLLECYQSFYGCFYYSTSILEQRKSQYIWFQSVEWKKKLE